MRMKEFNGKVAVITGAGSGIGLSLANLCATEGMKVVLADINEENISLAKKSLVDKGAEAISVVTDVTKPEAVDNLAQEAFKAFGEVHLLFNNAGIIWQKPFWESTLTDWALMINVNIFGVINGIRAFVPRMLDQKTEGRVINTASLAGLTYGEVENSAYYGTKSAVVALSEALDRELRIIDANVGVSIVIPTLVATALVTPKGEVELKSKEKVNNMFQAGAHPNDVAKGILKGIRDDKLFIFPDGNLVTSFMITTRSRGQFKGIRQSKSLGK